MSHVKIKTLGGSNGHVEKKKKNNTFDWKILWGDNILYLQRIFCVERSLLQIKGNLSNKYSWRSASGKYCEYLANLANDCRFHANSSKYMESAFVDNIWLW